MPRGDACGAARGDARGLNEHKLPARMRSASSARGYMAQLDALRFFAVIAVIVSHNWHPGPKTWIFGQLYWGPLGVRLFFVLSGFLITGILIGCRELGERSPEGRLFFIRQFYVRRFLRIFPVYYVTLAVLVAVGVGPAREIWPWLFTYTTNIYIWHYGWPAAVQHFWSLAVEEQFYLVWPWLVMFLPRRWLVPLLVGLICLAPVYRLYASFHYGQDNSLVFTVGVLDSLGLGALLAIAAHGDRGGMRLQRTLRRIVLPVGAVGYTLLWIATRSGPGHQAWVVLGDTAAALVFCWLVGSASRGFGGRFGRLLEWKPIAYLGKISYGIYIFHYLVPIAFGAIAKQLGISYHDIGFVNFVASSLVTFAVAALSWHLLESPINGLKRHFRYDSDRDTHPVTSVVPATEAQAVAS
jgi:peptidoglycan/LPS O-acetylase OafA/YrhL